MTNGGDVGASSGGRQVLTTLRAQLRTRMPAAALPLRLGDSQVAHNAGARNRIGFDSFTPAMSG